MRGNLTARSGIENFVSSFELTLERLRPRDDFRVGARLQRFQILVSDEGVECIEDVQPHRQPLWLQQMPRISYATEKLPQLNIAVDVGQRRRARQDG